MENILNQAFLGNTVTNYLIAVGIVIGGIVIIKIFKGFLIAFLILLNIILFRETSGNLKILL